MRSTVEAGGADPDNARRSGLVPVIFRPATGAHGATLTAWSCSCHTIPRPLRRVTGRGRWRGSRARQPPRPQGHRPKGASEAAAPQRRGPGSPATHGRSSRRLTHPPVFAPARGAWSRRSGVAHRRCALETVEKIVTALDWLRVRGA